MGRASQDPWSLSYQCQCNAAAQDAGLASQGDGPAAVKGLFSAQEMRWMGHAFKRKWTAAQFIEFVRAARERGGVKATTFHTSRPNG
jgi:hypothetical protein